MSMPRVIGSTRTIPTTTRNGKKRLRSTDSRKASKSWREGTRDSSFLASILDVGERSPLHVPTARARGTYHRNHFRRAAVCRALFRSRPEFPARPIHFKRSKSMKQIFHRQSYSFFFRLLIVLVVGA